MFDKWLKLPAHYYLKIIALVLLTIGVCLHNTLMSIGTIWIAANWLIEAKYPAYWTKFKGTPAIWFLLAILAYSFLSLTWSDDVAFGLKDIGKKMPFFVIPFVLGLSKPLEQKVRDFLFYLFLVILVLASFINFYRFNYVLEAGHDIREMSYFISHVRFSILTVLGIAVGFHLISKQIRRGFVLVPVILWLLYYTYKSQIINGYVLLITLLFMSALFALMKLKSRPLKFSGLTLLVIATSGFVYKVSETLDSFEEPVEVNISELPKYTESGNLYMHDLKSKLRENGNLLWYYLQPIELENEWNKRSTIDYRAKDQKNQPMFGTLIRYMTSRDLTKDSAGVAQLSDKEVVAIENGSTSIRINDGLSAKVDEFMYQWFAYKNEGNPNGNSLLQRLEHLNVGWSIAAKNLFFGVGIGDVHASFLKEYELLDSQLLAENQHRAHNQYLTYWISLGILGLLIFLAFLCSPMRYTKEKDYIFYAIFLVLTISLFFQDLLETQAGVCIFGLFYGLMAFTAPANPEEHPSLLGSDQ